jgi:hypothetical protein
MEWAGGVDWESYVDDLAKEDEDGAIKVLSKEKKLYPKDWEWKGEHWKIARSVPICILPCTALTGADTFRGQVINTCLTCR